MGKKHRQKFYVQKPDKNKVFLHQEGMMRIGYARVSVNDQNLDLQIDALERAGCLKIFKDQMTGRSAIRPGFCEMMKVLRGGALLVVWRLDRLGRSLKHLIEFMTHLEEKKAGLVSLTESIDTTTSSGKLIFHIFGALPTAPPPDAPLTPRSTILHQLDLIRSERAVCQG